MSRRPTSLAILVLVAGLVACAPPGVPDDDVSITKFVARSARGVITYAPNELMAKVRERRKDPPIAGTKVLAAFAEYELHRLPPGLPFREALPAYERDANVVWVDRVVPNRLPEDKNPYEGRTPAPSLPPVDRSPPAPASPFPVDDPRYGEQYVHAALGVAEAWKTTRGREDVVVAVVDQGVFAAHPDLAGRVIDGPSFADDGESSADRGAHGTAVASVVAARADDGYGMAGIAPGVKVLALRVEHFEPGRGKEPGATVMSDFKIARAIHHAATTGGAKVINLSLTLTENRVLVEVVRAARRRGVVVCVAAGNDGLARYGVEGIDGTEAIAPDVLVVHALDPFDRLAPFSNYGTADGVSAPGVDVLAALGGLRSTPRPGEPPDPDHWPTDGTSIAAPVVSAVAALVVSAVADGLAARLGRPVAATEVPGDLVVDLLRASCVDLGDPGPDERFGAGRVDAAAAVALARDPAWLDRAAAALGAAGP